LIRRDMQDELIVLQRQMHKTIIFITHDLNEALILGEHIAIMKEGRFVQVGTPQEIVSSPADDYVAAFTQDVDRGRVFTARTVMKDAHPLDAATTPRAALERMRELGRSALHVIEGGRILGLVFADDLEKAGRGDGDLAAQVVSDYPSTPRDAYLNEVYAACVRGWPVAVVSESGELQGVVEPGDVFAALAGNGGDEANDTAASGPAAPATSAENGSATRRVS